LDPTTYWEMWKSRGGSKKKNEETGKTVWQAPTLEESRTEVVRLMTIVDEVERLTETCDVPFGVFQVKVGEAKRILCRHATELATALVRGLVDQATSESRVLESEYSNMFEKVSVTPSSEAQLVEQRNFIRGLDMVLLSMYRRSKAATKSVELRRLVRMNLNEEEFFSLYHPKTWPNKIIDAKDLCAQELEKQKTAMIEVLERDVRKFEKHLDKLSEEADACKLLSDVDQLKLIVDRTDTLLGALEQARERGVDLNARLNAFGWDENPFVTLDVTENGFQQYGQMWTEFAEFRANRNEWLNESFLQLDGVQVREQVERTWVNSYKMAKRFAKDDPELAKVAQTLREETTSFKELVPIIEALGNKAMKERHWNTLAIETDCDIVSCWIFVGYFFFFSKNFLLQRKKERAKKKAKKQTKNSFSFLTSSKWSGQNVLTRYSLFFFPSSFSSFSSSPSSSPSSLSSSLSSSSSSSSSSLP